VCDPSLKAFFLEEEQVGSHEVVKGVGSDVIVNNFFEVSLVVVA
jgi:hypothetical protein